MGLKYTGMVLLQGMVFPCSLLRDGNIREYVQKKG